MHDLATFPLKSDASRNVLLQLYPRGKGRAEDTKCGLSFAGFFWKNGCRWYDMKFPHMKSVGAMSVKQLRRAHIVFADQGRDAREREFQFLRIRRSGNEQTALQW